MNLATATAAGVTVAVVATAASIRLLKRRSILDVPNERSSHTRPTVRGGGVGLAAGTVTALAVGHTGLSGSVVAALVVGGLGFGIIGLTDDLTGSVPVVVRLALQLVVGAAAATILLAHGPNDVALTALAAAAAALWIVAFVNAFNFMDGINGISCAEAIVAGVALGMVARHQHQPSLEVASFALAAGAVGFAPFNFPTARVFLGDVGSYFAGAWLAILVVFGIRVSIPPEAVVAPVALYVADTGVTLAVRMWRHQPWQQAHRDHAYQRLVDLGWSHIETTGLIALLVALCSALGSVSLWGSTAGRVTADSAIVMLIAGYLALPGLVAGRRSPASRGHQAQRVVR